MKKNYIPTSSLEDWKRLLAEPEKHWKPGYSSQALALAWENAREGFPTEIKEIFATSGIEYFRDIELLLAFPEWKVYLPPRGHPSQNDLFVLGKDAQGELLAIMVEGKVNETFGERLEQWLAGATPGKRARLNFIQEKLGLPKNLPLTIRYQFLHRMVSAFIEAERFKAKSAVMLVHSFSQGCTGFEDFVEFLRLFGINTAQAGILYTLAMIGEVNLYAGWVAA